MGLPPRNPLSVADHHRNYGQTASAMADNRQKGENRQRPNDAISEACPLSHSDLLFIEAKKDRHSAKQICQ
jgi:hypothetical protein